MNLEGKKFVVVGGAGLIGSHTVDALLQHGVKEVVVYDKDETASISSAEKLAKNNDLNVIYLEGGIQSWVENNLPLVEKT